MAKLLRPDLQRSWEVMEKLPRGSVVLDADERAWQFHGMFWHAAAYENSIPAFELAQRGPVKVIHKGKDMK